MNEPMPEIIENMQTEIDDTWVEELISLTQKEIYSYRMFLNQLKAQQNAIIDRDVLQITECREHAEEFMNNAKQNSLDRRNKMQHISAQIRPTKELQSLEQVIPIVKRQYAARLNELREKLKSVLNEIKSSNQMTAFLLTQSINYVNKNLRLIYDAADQSQAYAANGEMQHSKKYSTMVQVV